MENSSYSVKPELFSDTKEIINIKFIESVKSVSRFKNYIKVSTNINDFYIELYKNETIRFVTYNDDFDLEKSFSLEKIANTNEFDIINENDKTFVSFLNMEIVINHKPFVIDVYKNKKLKFKQKAIGFCNTQTYLFLERNCDDFIYGLGEKTGFLNKNNEKTVMWNKDVYEPHTRTNKELYQSINMFTYMSRSNKYGLFLDNPSKVIFDFVSNLNECVIISDIGKLDYYIYTKDSLKDILVQHSLISGKTYLPPIWALGYHQSRHSYESVDKLLEVYENFKNKDIPIDAIYLDILYMDKYKVFTFNKETYKGIDKVIKELKNDGVRIVPIVDPGVKVEEDYDIYEDGVKNNLYCKDKDGEIYTGEVWPGMSAFYDFTNEKIREQWGLNHKFYTDLGIEGIWNDMNEPSVFNSKNNTMDLDVCHNEDGKIKTHREIHNLYGLGMSMATFNGIKTLLNKRPFVLTRAGYAGIQKYATVWTGDNRSSWEHLEMTLPMCLNLNMSGVTLCGPDIGGFSDDTTEELLIRWTQMGTFLPFFRNHSSIGTKEQEPWQFGNRCEEITRKFIKLRYRLIRYIYSEVFKSHISGIPVMRPLVLEYENDPLTYSIHDEFLLGENILVAPILRPGETYRKVYLPKGVWYNFFTNEKFEGGKYIIAKAEIDEIPVFIKGGSVIPLSDDVSNTSKLNNHIILNVYDNNNNSFTSDFIIDDGISYKYQDGDFSNVYITYSNGEVKIDNKVSIDFEVNIIK